MPVVITISSAIVSLARSDVVQTTASESNGCIRAHRAPVRNEPIRLKNARIADVWPVFRPVFLDSRPSAAISPGTRRGNSSRRLFLRGFEGSLPDRAEIESITTEEKAGPDPSEAGIEHEGIERCSQSSKLAGGSTVSFRMMCWRCAERPGTRGQ